MHLAMDVCSLNGAQRATIWQLLGSRYTQNAASFGPLLPLSMVSLIACHQTFGCFSGKCPSWTGMGDFLTRFNCHRQKFHQWTIAHHHVPTSRFDAVGRYPRLCFPLACDTYGLMALHASRTCQFRSRFHASMTLGERLNCKRGASVHILTSVLEYVPVELHSMHAPLSTWALLT